MPSENDIFKSGTWDETKEEAAAFGKASYKTLEDGPNQLRILGTYVFRSMHYYPEGRIKHIQCAGEDCPLCATGDVPKFSYYINVLDRVDDEVKIMRFGKTIKNQITNIAKSYGDPTEYDLIIMREGKGLATKYNVIPARESKEIDEALKAKIQRDFYDLNTIMKPLTVEDVQELMSAGDDTAGDSTTAPSSLEQTAAPVEQAPPVQKAEPVKEAAPVQEAPAAAAPVEEKKEEKPPVVEGDKPECYGQKFNPINPQCKDCSVAEACKDEVIKMYSGEAS